MKILLNDQPVEVVEGLTPELTLEGLLDALGADLREKGLTIVRVTVDGAVIDPEDVVTLQSRRALECGMIDVVAATTQELVRVMVADSGEVVPYLEGLAGETAGDLRLGQIKEGMDRFVGLVDGLEWLATLLSNLPSGFAAAMQESGKELRRQQILSTVKDRLTTLRASQEAQDWVGLADVLEYELPDLFHDCQEFFAALPGA